MPLDNSSNSFLQGFVARLSSAAELGDLGNGLGFLSRSKALLELLPHRGSLFRRLGSGDDGGLGLGQCGRRAVEQQAVAFLSGLPELRRLLGLGRCHLVECGSDRFGRVGLRSKGENVERHGDLRVSPLVRRPVRGGVAGGNGVMVDAVRVAIGRNGFLTIAAAD